MENLNSTQIYRKLFEQYSKFKPNHFINFQEYLERYGDTPICKDCGFPAGSECDCSNYDSEGNEL